MLQQLQHPHTKESSTPQLAETKSRVLQSNICPLKRSLPATFKIFRSSPIITSGKSPLKLFSLRSNLVNFRLAKKEGICPDILLFLSISHSKSFICSKASGMFPEILLFSAAKYSLMKDVVREKTVLTKMKFPYKD